jgi:DNA invertase Pin-like site-specific DNA recombinase
MKREFARRCRELMLAAWSAEIQEQLRLWAEELDRQADTLEHHSARKGLSHPRASAPSRRHRMPAAAQNWLAFDLAASGRHLQRLLADIGQGKVDVVVTYKIDRLTRSLADFAKIAEIFDARGVSFVSVTQQFNTTTSMGRLTLNVLLSFAQFEREVTGERIRDKIAASKKKGMWMGGMPPLGYQVRDHKLVIVPGEADTVRHIFRRYLALGSVRLLRDELQVQGVVSKQWTSSSGRSWGG